jgi:transcriptional regulator with XRE-family HTH domain
MILARQIRAARGMIGMSQLELSHETGISVNTISKIEKSQEDLEKSGVGTINKIKNALEDQGIKFISTRQEDDQMVTGIKFYFTKP